MHSIYRRKNFWIPFLGLCFLLAGIIALIFYIIKKTDDSRAVYDGQMRLASITAEVESSLFQAECTVESLASELESYFAAGSVDEAALMEFVGEKTNYILNKNEGGLSVYVVHKNKLYISSSFDMDNFVLEERDWYKGALKQRGAVYFSSPYQDAATGKMCCSVSKLLSDGETILSVDYNLDRIQAFLEKMGSASSAVCMIVNENGTIIEHSDAENVGKNYQLLPYADLVRKVFSLYGESFVYSSDKEEYTVFSEKTSYGWYLIVCVSARELAGDLSGELKTILIFLIVLSVALLAFYTYSYAVKAKSRKKAEEIEKIAGKVSSVIDSLSEEDRELIYDGGEVVSQNTDMRRVYRKGLGLTVLLLTITGAAMLINNTYTHIRAVSSNMRGNAKIYCGEVKEWVAENRAFLLLLSEVFSTQPEMTEDYEGCVEYLSGIVSENDDISIAYIVNPEWETSVITSSGWKPSDPSWRAEDRKWYKETMESEEENGFNISTPYYDERTGLYCVTMSQIVYDETGNFVGVLGIDYYMDKLVSILGENYSEDGYAFLLDSYYNIYNHPNPAYQMTDDSYVNARKLCYRDALFSDRAVVITDYDGKKKLCLVEEEKIFGFSVVHVKGLTRAYRNLFVTDLMITAVFSACIVMVFAIMRRLNDVQQQVQKELQDVAETATAASHAKDDFLANMSHEIRTLMNSVVGMTELILRENDISPTVREYCYNIQNSGKNLLSIINDILDFSKIESGKMEIIKDEVEISSMFNDLINMAVTRIENKPLELIVMADPNIPSQFIADELRIRQVAINLLNNAIKYSKEGHVILNIFKYKWDGTTSLYVEVMDTGVGIKEEDIKKLFTSFQQLDTRKNRAVEGTGLGLAISKRLVDLMDGEMEVSSDYGKGSKFGFKVPIDVVDDTPFLSVKDAKNTHVMIYVDLDRYEKEEVQNYTRITYNGLGENLHVDVECVYTFEELKDRLEVKDFTHVIVGKEEYLAQKEYFRDVKGLVILKKRGDTSLSELNCTFKPLSAITLTALLNNESASSHLKNTVFTSRFTASKAKVLIVDDNAVNLQVAEGLLKPYRMTVVSAQRALEAIELLKSKDFDIVFMDHMMPEVDGVEAAAIIRNMEDEYFQKLPIIALTANAVRGAREGFLDAGMNDFISKPINPRAFDNALRAWLPENLIERAEETADNGDSLLEKLVPEGDAVFNPRLGLF